MGIEVDIFGQKYMIKGGGDREYISMLADYVDSKMREVNGTLHLSTPEKVAILAALNITHELFTLRKDVEVRESALSEKAEKLLELISLEIKI